MSPDSTSRIMIKVTTSTVIVLSNCNQSAPPSIAGRSTLTLLPLGPTQTRYRPILARQVAMSIMSHTISVVSSRYARQKALRPTNKLPAKFAGADLGKFKRGVVDRAQQILLINIHFFIKIIRFIKNECTI